MQIIQEKPVDKISERTSQRLPDKIKARVSSFFPLSYAQGHQVCAENEIGQCLCEICLNPILKVSRLNSLSHKSESMRKLLKESMSGFEGVPHLLCVDRQCCECGTACVVRRLKEEFGELVQKSVSWSRWEVVKQGRTSRVEKVKRSGMVGDCTAELGQELGPLCRHVFNAEWQRQQLQLLKANLPTGWVLATCNFVENVLCRSQDEPQSTGVQAGDHFSCGLFLQVYFWM